MSDNWNLGSAIAFCESLGLVVFDKDKLKTLQFTVANTKQDHFAGKEEYIEKEQERKAIDSIISQLMDSGFIQVTEWEDKFVKFKRWKLKVVE